MCLFNEAIENWKDWGHVFQSIPAFKEIVFHILNKENLKTAEIENLTPGTNAVFKVGSCVIKIFAPAESGMDQTCDLETELFAIKRANAVGISTPRLIAYGEIWDKYKFSYVITEFVAGIELAEAFKTMSDERKVSIGKRLRTITDKMNTSCEPFNDIDIINDRERQKRWESYPVTFKNERRAYIDSLTFEEMVFVHGDLCGDNILITSDDELFVIDFADSVRAPREYEHALVAVELFEFDKMLLKGYFGDYLADGLTEICLNGLLIHDFGGDIIKIRIAPPGEIHSLAVLRKKIRNRFL